MRACSELRRIFLIGFGGSNGCFSCRRVGPRSNHSLTVISASDFCKATKWSTDGRTGAEHLMNSKLEFPVPPDDVRFLCQSERYHRYVVPPTRAMQPMPDWPSGASLAAERILSRYVQRHRSRKRRAGPFRRIGKQLFEVACTIVAAGMLPVTIVGILVMSDDLRGKALRAAIIRPDDIMRKVHIR